MIAILFLIFLVGLIVLVEMRVRMRDVEKRLAEIERHLAPAAALDAEISKIKATQPEPPLGAMSSSSCWRASGGYQRCAAKRPASVVWPISPAPTR